MKALLLILLLTACGNDGNNDIGKTEPTPKEETNERITNPEETFNNSTNPKSSQPNTSNTETPILSCWFDLSVGDDAS